MYLFYVYMCIMHVHVVMWPYIHTCIIVDNLPNLPYIIIGGMRGVGGRGWERVLLWRRERYASEQTSRSLQPCPLCVLDLWWKSTGVLWHRGRPVNTLYINTLYNSTNNIVITCTCYSLNCSIWHVGKLCQYRKWISVLQCSIYCCTCSMGINTNSAVYYRIGPYMYIRVHLSVCVCFFFFNVCIPVVFTCMVISDNDTI